MKKALFVVLAAVMLALGLAAPTALADPPTEFADGHVYPACDGDTGTAANFDHYYPWILPQRGEVPPGTTTPTPGTSRRLGYNNRDGGQQGQHSISVLPATRDGQQALRSVHSIRPGDVVKAGPVAGSDGLYSFMDYPSYTADYEACWFSGWRGDSYEAKVYNYDEVDGQGMTDYFQGISSLSVFEGDNIDKGQVIGHMGGPSRNFLEVSMYADGPAQISNFVPGSPRWENDVNIDPYGWDEDHNGDGTRELADAADPWYNLSGWSSNPRQLRPRTQPYVPCPSPCVGQVWEVDDADATTSCLGSGSGLDCIPFSEKDIQNDPSRGLNGTVSFHQPTGLNGSLRKLPGGHAQITWRAPAPAGTYRVSACFAGTSFLTPSGGERLPARLVSVAEYHMLPMDIIVRANQQAMFPAGGCITLGTFSFPAAPEVQLTSRSYYMDTSTDPPTLIEWGRDNTCMQVLADVIRFEKICAGGNYPQAATHTPGATPSPALTHTPAPTWTPRTIVTPLATKTPGATTTPATPTFTPPATPTFGPTSTPKITITPGCCDVTPWPGRGGGSS